MKNAPVETNVVSWLTRCLGVGQQMSHGARGVDTRLGCNDLVSSARHLPSDSTHPSSSDAPHTSAVMKPSFSFTRLHLLTSSVATSRILSGFSYLLPTRSQPPHPPSQPPAPLVLTQTGSCNGWTFPLQHRPGCQRCPSPPGAEGSFGQGCWFQPLEVKKSHDIKGLFSIFL